MRMGRPVVVRHLILHFDINETILIGDEAVRTEMKQQSRDVSCGGHS
jgi:hypothetical protein